MTVEITARHFSPSSKLNDLIQKKIIKIERYFDNLISCHVVLNKETNAESIEIKAHIKGRKFFASDSSPLFEKSLTVAIDKIITQIKKHHDKKIG